MATTIQISEGLHDALRARKLYEKESYEEVIQDLIEDVGELNAQTKKELAQARAEARAGKTFTLAQVKHELGF